MTNGHTLTRVVLGPGVLVVQSESRGHVLARQSPRDQRLRRIAKCATAPNRRAQGAGTTVSTVYALEDDSVHTQDKSLDKIIRNISEEAESLHGEKQVQVELVVPPDIGVA